MCQRPSPDRTCLTVNSTATVPTPADGEAIVVLIARMCRTTQMQMLAFQERVWTRSAITLAPVLLVTQRVSAQDINTTATGRIAARRLPSTMPISLTCGQLGRSVHPRWGTSGTRIHAVRTGHSTARKAPRTDVAKDAMSGMEKLARVLKSHAEMSSVTAWCLAEGISLSDEVWRAMIFPLSQLAEHRIQVDSVSFERGMAT